MEKLCIEVRGFSEEKKKRVQDAFFKLGICWGVDGCNHSELNAERYGNIYRDGDISEYLLFGYGDMSEAQKPYEVTYTELMEKAGLPIGDPDVEESELVDGGIECISELDLHETIKSYLFELENTQDAEAREILVAYIEKLLDVEFQRLTGGNDE